MAQKDSRTYIIKGIGKHVVLDNLGNLRKVLKISPLKAKPITSDLLSKIWKKPSATRFFPFFPGSQKFFTVRHEKKSVTFPAIQSIGVNVNVADSSATATSNTSDLFLKKVFLGENDYGEDFKHQNYQNKLI